MLEIELIKLNDRLNKIKDKVLFYKLFVSKLDDDLIDFDISKMLKILEMKVMKVEPHKIEENMDSFYFLLDLWEKDMERIEDYLCDYHDLDKFEH